jgi:hypothetical protein
MKLFLSLVMLVSFSFDASAQGICAQKKKEYGTRFLSCTTVDWGMKPISADYQPANAGRMTALPGEIKNGLTQQYDYKNEYPGIAGTRPYFEGNYYGDPNRKGLPLAAKFASAVAAKEGEDSDLVQWLSTDWYNSLQPDQSSGGWEGKCSAWSGWSMDPELQKIFSQVRDGLLCNGVPFSRGELKEIVTSLYSEPVVIDRKSLQGFYRGYAGVDPKVQEDANVALAKLGLMGTGDFTPDQVAGMAKNAKDAGRNLMMDKDAGSETWNQPVKQVTDVAYDDDSLQEWDVLSTADFEAGSQPEVLDQLITIEKEFASGLVKQNGIPESPLCNRYKESSVKLPKEICDGFNGLSLTGQVAKFNSMKQAAFGQKSIRLKTDLVLVKHELIVEYGDESTWASSKADQTKTQSYTYVAVHRSDVNGKAGTLVRSQWNPPTRRLSEVCQDKNFKNRVVSSLVKPIDPDQACADLKNGGQDFELFTGAVPPENFREYHAEPAFSPTQTKKAQAYRKFLEFMASCQNFDEAAQFLRDLDQAILNNDISSDESQKIQASYPKVKAMIDAQWLNEYLDQKQSVQGLPALKQKLLSL